MDRPGFWSPYLLGAIVAAIGYASAAIFLWLLWHGIWDQAATPWLYVSLAITALSGFVLNPRFDAGLNVMQICCPECSKSIFDLYGGESGWRLGLAWPEHECSECHHDLTEPFAR